jgi:putative acetyltransferase
MIEIRRIEPDEWAAAKLLVYRVAHALFHDPLPLHESIVHHEERGALDDMNDIQTNYFESGGIFLVMTDNDEIICTGAIRRYADDICELKRLWLLQEHQGKGLGYRMIQELCAFAKDAGYRRVILETDPVAQPQAYNLYKRIGFRDLHPHPDHPSDMVMEMAL